MWLGSAENLVSQESEDEQTAATPEPPKRDDETEEEPTLAPAHSEIELPSPTPKPTPTAAAATRKPAATPAAKPKITPKPIARPTPKKTLVTKAMPKSSPKSKSSEKSGKSKKAALAKNEPQSGSGKSSPTGKVSHTGGGTSASEFGWYGNMLHDRFYSAWIQPTTHVPTGAKISTSAKVRIEKDGHVSKFEIIKPSENAVVNESVAAVAKQVTEVDSPPAGLIKGDHYDVKITFELNTGE